MNTDAAQDARGGRPRAVVRWLGKSFGAMADQGLFSVANFLLNICLAGWLTAGEYGAFAVGYTMFSILGSLYATSLVMPLLVFGAGRYRERVGDYLGTLLGAHVAFCALAGFLLLLGAGGTWLYGSRLLAVTLLSLACTQPCILLLWLCRRACYIASGPWTAASAGLAYLLLMGAGLALLNATGCLSIPSVLALMALDSLVMSLWLIMKLGVTRPHRVRWAMAREVMTDHWQYGRWALPTTLVDYLASNCFVLLLPLVARMEDCGTLRALMNLIMPMLQVIVALSTLLLPQLVRTSGTAGFGRVVRVCLLSMVAVPVAYWLLLSSLGVPIVGLAYHGRYVTDAHLLWLVGLLPVLEGLTVVPALALQARNRVDCTFWAALGAGVAGLAVGLPLLYAYGLVGAIVARILYGLFQSMLLWFLWFRTSRRSHAPPGNWGRGGLRAEGQLVTTESR